MKPNFFIVGAPKCGTTALSEYLRSHPNIFISRPKEPFFFMEDFPNNRIVETMEQYLKLFNRCTNEHLAIGEASTWYLYSQVAVRNIYKFNKNAKIIVMLRNPIDMLYSLHSQHVYSLIEWDIDFETAWRLQSSRKKGKKIPDKCKDQAFLQYKEIAMFGSQVERLLGIFPREQVKIILFNDFKTKTKVVYEEVLSFLNLPSDGRAEFPIINPGKTHRVRPPYFIIKMVNLYKKGRLFGMQLPFRLINLIKSLNSKKSTRKELNPEFRQELVTEFRDDIEKLSHILKKDLSHWLM